MIKTAPLNVEVHQFGAAENVTPAHLLETTSQLAKYFTESKACGQSIMFARTEKTIIGGFVSGETSNEGASRLIQDIGSRLASSNAIPRTFFVQTHGSNQTGSDAVGIHLGMYGDLGGNLLAVQDAVRKWVNGEHLDGSPVREVMELPILASPFDSIANVTNSTYSQPHVLFQRRAPIESRATCRDIQVFGGDSCGSLASKCGISGSDFTKYNNNTKNFCSTLKPKQWVCCSAGSLPDHRPQPNKDGTCNTYHVQDGDGCWSIADAFGISQDDIEKYNKKTWGWGGCKYLQKEANICLSKGDPPSKYPLCLRF